MINCVHFACYSLVSSGKTVCLYRVQNLLNRSIYCMVLLSRSALWIVSARLDKTITTQTSFHCGMLMLCFAFRSILFAANSDDSGHTQRRNSKNWPRDGPISSPFSAAHLQFCYLYSYNKANELHYFSDSFDKVLYIFRAGPLSIIRSISTLYTRNRYLSF
jgi:hypothetical protein